ncbi:MAG: CARDB domain-containing protein [Candidatus Micrarchaeia archaeon]
MKNEAYYWVVVVIAIIAAAIYIRLFYQPPISLEISMNESTNLQRFPYQPIYIPITVTNTGSVPIRNMSIGVYVNSTLNMLYHVTVPPGKEVILKYSYVPVAPGNYTIEAAADPANLYNIEDRSLAQKSLSFTVFNPENAMPYSSLPLGNATSKGVMYLKTGGYVLSSYLNATYGLKNMKLTSITYVNAFLDSVLTYVIKYVKQFAGAYASYTNGSEAYSIWIQGYISPNITNVAARLSRIPSANLVKQGKNVTFVNLGNNTTICSYYSQGWIKMLVYKSQNNQSNCASELGLAKMQQMQLPALGTNAINANETLGNFTIENSTSFESGELAFINDSFVYSLASNSSLNTTCFGLISSQGNESYCSEYVFPLVNETNGTALIRTAAHIGNYSIAVYSLINSSLLFNQLPVNIRIIKGYGVLGHYALFTSGIQNTCQFNSTFSCSNLTFENGEASFNISSNETVRLNSVSCFTVPAALPNEINETLQSKTSKRLSVACYANGNKLAGMPLNLRLNFLVNYTISNTTRTGTGTGYIPFG